MRRFGAVVLWIVVIVVVIATVASVYVRLSTGAWPWEDWPG